MDSDHDKCHIFTNVFTEEDCTSIPQYQLDSCHNYSAIVLDKLKHLNPTKSPSPEDWLLLYLKESASKLCIPLSILFNKSLECSKLPDLWRKPLITPVFKKGNCCLPCNYSLISLTSPICKIMESIFEDNVQKHLQANNVIPPEQHGFTPHQ